MDKVRIQIVNYKTKKYLIGCLTSLSDDLKDFVDSYSIGILDNASGEDLSDIPVQFPSFKNIEIYQGEKNLGFGSGHNFLAKKGEAEYLLILNPDLKFIEPNTILRLIRTLNENRTQVAGPRLLTAEGNTQMWDHGELHGLLARIALNSGSSFWKEQKIISEAAWVSGAVFLINKKWFVDLEGFDEKFFLYKEEEDLCWRLREKGGKVVYDPAVTVLHYGEVIAKKSDHIQKSVDYFVTKHLKHRFGYLFFRLLNKILIQ